MHNIYISGSNTFQCKEEIKRLLPTSKSFRKYWKFNKHFKAWHLEKVSDGYMTINFIKLLENFTNTHHLTLEIWEEPKKIIKGITDYSNEDEYWEAFHKRNKPYR